MNNRETRRFRFRPLPTAAAVLGTLILVSLGVWQLGRAADKEALLARYDAVTVPVAWRELGADAPRFAHTWLQGEYDDERQVLLDGVTHDRRAGYQVLTPLRLADGSLVMVNRGWRPFEGARDALSPLPAPQGVQRIEGRVSPFFRAGMRLGGDSAGDQRDWPRLAVYPSAAEVSAWLGEQVNERMLLLSPDAPGGYLREWQPVEFPPSRHVAYALQWFAFAATLVVGSLIAARVARTDKGIDAS